MGRINGLVTGAFLLLASMAIVFGLYRFTKFWMGNPNATGKAVFYEVKAGVAPITIAKDLERLGVVFDSRLFYWYGRLTGKSARIKTGDYKFSDKMNPSDVMAILMSGVSFGFPVTIPEGYNIDQVAAVLEKAKPGLGTELASLARDPLFVASLNLVTPTPKTLEGFLFPDTYYLTRQTTAKDLILQMIKRYQAVFDDAARARAKEMGFTEYQILTLASIVEKETGAPSERPLVASVFHNRLKKRMRLQSDPTIIYGLKDYNGNIRKKDILANHPYNTYVIPALPIGPIANPGKEAILATLSPESSSYLYFVSKNDGTHEFTSTYAEHQKAVTRFQLDRKAREGRSWRELSNKSKSQAEAQR